MTRRVTSLLAAAGFLALLLALHPSLGQAGFLDQVGGALDKMGGQVSKDLKKAGRELGVVEQKKSNSSSQGNAASGLPSAVSHRLKKANQELDKADKALAQGSGSAQDRAKRAEMYLNNAKRIRAEIDQRYQGRFPPDHPDIQAFDQRLAGLEEQVASGGQAPTAGASAASANQDQPPAKLPAAVTNRIKKIERELDRAEKVLAKTSRPAEYRSKQGNYHLQAALSYREEISKNYGDQAPASHPDLAAVDQRIAAVKEQLAQAGGQAATAQAEKDQARQSQAAAADLSAQWAAKLKPYITASSGKEFIVYATNDAAIWQARTALYNELGPLWEQYQQTDFKGKKSMELQSIDQQLGRQVKRYKELYPKYQKKMQQTAALKGAIVFSKSPINPANPQNLTNSFKAGDHIYGLIMTKKSFEEIFGRQVNVMIQTRVDGKKIHSQFIILNRPQEQNSNRLLFEIAPDPGKMTAYSNPDIKYGESKPGMRQGPQELTHYMSQFGPGKHTLSFQIAYFNVTHAEGSFTIEGPSFQGYAKLNEQVQQAVAQSVTLPPAKMTNKQLAGTMRSLLRNAGWPEIYRLNIVDKDWWIDRVAGGNSAVKSRHLAAAAMAQDSNGNYYYKVCTFHQPMLITGAWGKLELTHQGAKRPVSAANKDK